MEVLSKKGSPQAWAALKSLRPEWDVMDMGIGSMAFWKRLPFGEKRPKCLCSPRRLRSLVAQELAEQPVMMFRGRFSGIRVVDFGLMLSSVFG